MLLHKFQLLLCFLLRITCSCLVFDDHQVNFVCNDLFVLVSYKLYAMLVMLTVEYCFIHDFFYSCA